MKNILLIALTLLTNIVTAQTQLSDYYDASSANRPEFSYNIKVRIQKTTGATTYDTRYSATLSQALPDSKGFYNATGDKKFYTCGQLGNICNPNNIHLISVRLSYTCNGQQKADVVVFRNLNDVQQINVVVGAGGKFCESIDFNMNVMGATLEPTHLGQIIDKINQIGSTKTTQNNSNNNNPATQAGTTNTGMPANTSGNDPLAHFETDGKTYTNPMSNNTNSGSSAVDNFNKNYQQGQQIANSVTPIASTLVDAWNRKIDRENASIEKSRSEQYKRVDDYENFCSEANKMIFDWPYYEKNVIQRLPLMLENESPSWASILGTDKFSSAFGKDAYYVIDNFKPYHDYNKNALRRLKSNEQYPLQTSGSFYDFYTLSLNTDYEYDYFMDNVKLDNRFNTLHFIYDDNKMVIGILIEIDTEWSGRAIPIEKYYKDIISKIGNNYIMLDANTFLLRDKLIFFELGKIHMYDLNYMGNQLCYKISNVLNANPSLNLAAAKFGIPGIKFNETLNMDQNNIKWKPLGYLVDMKKKSYYKSDITNNQLVITKIDAESPWEKAGLMEGDIIKTVNNRSTPYPLFFRLSTFAYRSLGNMTITYLRNGKEYETVVNLLQFNKINTDLDKCVGVYKGDFVTAKVYIKNSTSYLYIENQPEYELEYVGALTYRIKQLTGYHVQFLKDGNNKISELIFIQPNGRFKAVRIQ